jgi:zinc protease
MMLPLAIALGLAAAPPLSAPHEIFQLKNGLTVVLHQDKTTPQVSVNLWYHVGSGRERPGRTGFAHLFEHIMFEGSAHVPEGAFDVWLEAAGGTNNGSTTEDRTNYYEDLPRGALDLALFLESDRMGYLLETMSPARVDGQRDIVKNERRQSYENRPYGEVWLKLPEWLYPAGHAYSWPVIGSMADLTAASFDDVTKFFRDYYGPNNASLVIAGDIDLTETRTKVETWFGELPRGREVERPKPADVRLPKDRTEVIQDDVQLEKVLIVWPSVPLFSEDDAALDALASALGDGKVSRLQRRLVHDLKKAQSVEVWHQSQQLSGAFAIEVLAGAGVTAKELVPVIDEELKKLIAGGVAERELQRVINQNETRFYDAFERIGGFGGRADRMNTYVFHGKPPDWFGSDLARYRKLQPDDLKRVAAEYLERPRLTVFVLPKPADPSGPATKPPASSGVSK